MNSNYSLVVINAVDIINIKVFGGIKMEQLKELVTEKELHKINGGSSYFPIGMGSVMPAAILSGNPDNVRLVKDINKKNSASLGQLQHTIVNTILKFF